MIQSDNTHSGDDSTAISLEPRKTVPGDTTSPSRARRAGVAFALPMAWLPGEHGTRVRVWKSMPEDEHYYGLGDKAGPLDRRGRAFAMWNRDAYSWQGHTDPLYKSIPFFIGLRGGIAYGVFFDNTHRSSFDFGKESDGVLSFGAEGGALDYYFIAGPQPAQVIERYTALTGRTPGYGYHLPEQRLGTALVEVRDQPQTTTDWGALGCYVGRRVNDYWQVPVITGLDVEPTVDQLKQLGASLASYGSLAMFHLVGVTPEARTADEAFGGRAPERRLVLTPGSLRAVYETFQPERRRPDVVAFTAPQLSIVELRDLAVLLGGRSIHPDVRLLITTNYQNRAAAERLGYAAAIEQAGGLLLSGACFYLMTARELAEKHGWRTILTDSAKLANIIPGYGYNPVFRPTDACVEAAVRGELVW